MQIVYISPEHPLNHKSGGVAAYVKKTSMLLSKRGHQVTVISLDSKNEEIEKDGIIYISISDFRKNYRLNFLGMLINSWRIRKCFKYVFKEYGCNVVQIANLKWIGLFIPKSLRYKKIVRISESRILYDQYSERNKFNSYLHELGEVLIMKRSDQVYSPSQFMANYYSKKYNFNVDVVRPPLPDTSIMSDNFPDYDLPDKYFIYVGAVSIRKGAKLLFESFNLAIKKNRNIKLIVIGEIKDGEVKGIIQKLPSDTKKNIIFLGLVEKNDVLLIMKKAHFAVLPSLVDNLPNTALESIAMKTPIVTIEESSVDELVRNTSFGIIVKRSEFHTMLTNISIALLKAWNMKPSACTDNLESSKLISEMDTCNSIRILENNYESI